MSSLNEVNLIGNLCADPEVRRMGSGDPVVNLRVATNETWKDKNTGERREKAEFHSVVIFNEGIAKVAEQYLRKGSKLFIRGALQTRSWKDQSGSDRYSTEVVLQKFRGELVLLDSASSSSGRTSDFDSENRGSNPREATKGTYGHNDLDDAEIPF